MSVSRILFGVLVALVAGQSEGVQNGYTVRNPTEFPYFVHIVTTPQSGAVRQSGGALLNDRWVVTARTAVTGAKKIMLYFGVYELDKIAFTKHLEVGLEHVVNYPTLVDDIALILLPEKLKFSSTIQPIQLADYLPKEGEMGVVVGFQSGQKILRYGFFRVQGFEVCRKTYGNFDLYKQICTVGWTNPNQRPCAGNEGSGLIVDWPQNPKLAGIYSQNSYCSSYPALYVGLEKYLFWIRSELANTPPLPPTELPSTTSAPAI